MYNKLPPYHSKVPVSVIGEDGVKRKVTKFRQFQCRDCGCAPDAPMIVDDVWRTLCGELEDAKALLLCCACVEHRLKRCMTPQDLTACAANGAALFFIDRYRENDNG